MSATKAIETLIASCERLDVAGTPDIAGAVEPLRHKCSADISTSAELAALTKAVGIDASAIVADCAALLGLTAAIHRAYAEARRSLWRADPLGQARAHEFVDLLGRRTSLQALLVDILRDSTSGMSAGQLRARFEAVVVATGQLFFASLEASLAAGQPQNVVELTNWCNDRLAAPAFKQLTGSILKGLAASPAH